MFWLCAAAGWRGLLPGPGRHGTGKLRKPTSSLIPSPSLPPFPHHPFSPVQDQGMWVVLRPGPCEWGHVPRHALPACAPRPRVTPVQEHACLPAPPAHRMSPCTYISNTSAETTRLHAAASTHACCPCGCLHARLPTCPFPSPRPHPDICAEWDFGGFPWWLASSAVREQ